MSKKRDKKTLPEIDSVVYCGPNLPGGSLAQFTVFQGGIPPHVKKMVEKTPAIGALIVPIKGLSNTRKKINEQGTKENLLYRQAKAHMRGDEDVV
ncbi:hypothetical protein [Aminobacterium sp. EBM-42]|jgi:hypothetical protein|uniref:hypothetical protein n=1 Tax=Aminobacterium sp. EBM-42 TaxID=1918503 RepID=UPI00257D2FB3|nr:hypothetical protein [Aminobacterium sp. EBM-42]